jgi:hypothetical protein
MPPKDMLYLLIFINGIYTFVAPKIYGSVKYNLVKYMVLILYDNYRLSLPATILMHVWVFS